ncbi:alkaline phosphatase family protein [Streptacidiphilus sp. EB129]|uniref:alkaline phosphatase family protein n=1 Tax=Streptacidiphilus sp. EB129 TaxID=3156262 RepID=UPI003518543E
MRTRKFFSAAAVLGLLAGLGSTAIPAAEAATSVPRPDHTLVVIMENHSYNEIIGDTTDAPYINSLAQQGANFTSSFAVSHPSEPNYLALFSGSTQGLTSDSCPHTYTTGSLGAEALSAGFGFSGYSESMPSQGYTGCTSGEYARKHNPWVNYSTIPTTDNKTFAQFPAAASYSTLPTLSFVVPNLLDDMHDGTIAQGDTWLKNNIDSYAQWAKAHNSLLVVTWDEDDSSQSNQIPTLFVGAGVKPGAYSENITHYSVLRTIEDAYGLGHLGSSASANPITDIWSGGSTGSVTLSTPANQSSTVGTAASLQLQATDTAGGTLNYTATGLPAGLSINTGTGLINGTPTTAGTSSVTVTATDSTGPSSSATFTWTVAGSGGGCTAAQLLGNPGFETGKAAPWTATAGVINSDTSSEPAHSGSWDAWLDGYGSPHTDTLAQKVTIPATCVNATLTYWLHVDTGKTGSTAADTLTLSDGSSTLATYSNLNANSGYTQETVNLSGDIGKTVTLTFTGTEDGNQQTSFVLDDTALNVS